jgi:phospholipid-binding lipoprotein MlaA
VRQFPLRLRTHLKCPQTLFACIVCVLVSPLSVAQTPDPWEGMNRKIEAFNWQLDRVVLRPVASGYTKVTPKPARRGVSNFMDNLLYPLTMVNQFLQGKPGKGFSDTGRFMINSTFGLLGLFDPATKAGLPKNEEDFGQTIAVWGVGSGPFLMIPFLGPSTLRDGPSRLLLDSQFFAPRYFDSDWARWGTAGLYFIDQRARVLDAESLIAGDRYLFLRDAWTQRREFLINDGVVADDPFLDDEEWDE